MRQLPYEFENEWLVLVPVLLIVYVLTTWIDGQVFGTDEPITSVSKKKRLNTKYTDKKGFGDGYPLFISE